MVPDLHPLEEQYVTTQSHLILNHNYQTKQEERQNILKMTGFNSSSRHLSDELVIKRLSSLFDQVEMKSEKKRQQYFRYLDKRSKKYTRFNLGNSILRYKSSHVLQDLSTKILFNSINKSSELRDDQLYESFPQQTMEKYPIIQRIFDTKLYEKKSEVFRNIVRNIYILVQLLGVDLNDVIKRQQSTYNDLSLFLYPNALEVLIQLNVYDAILPLDANYDQSNKQTHIRQGIMNGFFFGTSSRDNESHVNDFSLLNFYVKLMKNVGFENGTIRHVVNIRNSAMIKYLSQVSCVIEETFQNDFVVASKTFSSRLRKLNAECENQGITLASEEKFFIVTHWFLLSRNEEVPENLDFYHLLDVLNKRLRLYKDRQDTAAKLREMEDFLGEKSWRLFLHAYRHKEIFSSNWFQRNLSLLQSEAFTDQQIREGSQILLYAPALIETFIKSIDDNVHCYGAFEILSSWRQDPKALLKMCYYMERGLAFPGRKQRPGKEIIHKISKNVFPYNCKQIADKYVEEDVRMSQLN